MIQVICDACGKPIKNAHLDTTYVFRLGHDICMPCHNQLIESVDKVMTSRGPYSFERYWSTYGNTVKKVCK